MNFNGSPPVANAQKYAIEDLDYGIDWYYTGEPPWLLLDENIIESTWTFVDGFSDGALEIYQTVFTKTGTAFYCRNGTPGYVYQIQNTIVTNENRVGCARIALYVR